MGRSGDSLTAVSSLGVFLSLCLLSYYYWDNPKQPLRYGFFLFLVIALLVVVRHVWFCVVGPLKASFGNRKEGNGRYYCTKVCPEIGPALNNSCIRGTQVIVAYVSEYIKHDQVLRPHKLNLLFVVTTRMPF